MTRSLFFLLGIFFFFGIGNIVFSEPVTIEDHHFTVNDLYMNAYRSLDVNKSDNELTKKTYYSVAKSMGVEIVDLERMLLETPYEGCEESYGNQNKGHIACVENLIEPFCPFPKGQRLWFVQCQAQLMDRLQKEYSRTRFQHIQHLSAKSAQAFTNGTLQDTGGEDSFDIIVDLNIIDLILFGDKMTTPSSGSPFLPPLFANDSAGQNLAQSSGTTENNTGTGSSDQNTQGNTDDSDPGNTNSQSSQTNNTETNEDSDLGFCQDPNHVIFSSTVTTQIHTVESQSIAEGNNSDYTAGTNYSEFALGNFIPPQIQYSGGKYPDLSAYIPNKPVCEANEQPFFGGRVCIPEFCTDLICIKIKLKPGYREVNRYSTLDCVECHIERGFEFLSPFLGTIGANTPNSNSQEAYFLSAFANLFKSVIPRVTLKPKRLPFLIYDKSLADQKKEKSDTQNEDQNQEDDNDHTSVNNILLHANQKLYDELIEGCPEFYTLFPTQSGENIERTEYCILAQGQRTTLSQEHYLTKSDTLFSEENNAKKNTQRSVHYHDVIQPFFAQMSDRMVVINEHLQDIKPSDIQENGLHCKTISHPSSP